MLLMLIKFSRCTWRTKLWNLPPPLLLLLLEIWRLRSFKEGKEEAQEMEQTYREIDTTTWDRSPAQKLADRCKWPFVVLSDWILRFIHQNREISGQIFMKKRKETRKEFLEGMKKLRGTLHWSVGEITRIGLECCFGEKAVHFGQISGALLVPKVAQATGKWLFLRRDYWTTLGELQKLFEIVGLQLRTTVQSGVSSNLSFPPRIFEPNDILIYWPRVAALDLPKTGPSGAHKTPAIVLFPPQRNHRFMIIILAFLKLATCNTDSWVRNKGIADSRANFGGKLVKEDLFRTLK